MPKAAPSPCNHPGCGALTDARYCEAHARDERQAYDQRRGSSAARGYGRRWQKLRARKLKANTLCEECQRQGRTTVAREVDHIIPHKGDQKLFWDWNNLQSLCKPCHSSKTATEDGGGWQGAGGWVDL